jgi:cytoplasmic iron level regulating protein YaaA (DUF328/UPF0246 family)
MLIVISPAKTLDYKTTAPVASYSQANYLVKAKVLIDKLRQYSPAEIAQLMKISDPLAVLNVGRFSQWQLPFTAENSKQAIFTFMGDVYEGIGAYSLSVDALHYAQQHLRILSGLYGLLRPLDLIQAYRLEMGTKLANPQGKDLYAFWGNTLSEGLNAHLAAIGSDTLVNLASEEYFKAVKPHTLQAKVITPVFEDYKNGQYKVISFYAKRARGLMARFALMHQVNHVQALKTFNSEGYAFEPSASDATHWVFRRKLYKA